MVKLQTHNTIFIILSFEGPDQYSLAGGLGTRVDRLAETLAKIGFETHLFFIGDPSLPSFESRENGRYHLHRWCQWISAHHPRGVYDGENGKVVDFTTSVPAYIEKEIIQKATSDRKWTVVMAEEWQTAEALMAISDRLHWKGLRERTIFLWNANSVMSFNRINWGRLTYIATITAVSKFMKHILWQQGIDPIVIPNGIPSSLLAPLDQQLVGMAKKALKERGGGLNVLKIGRFDPAKRWGMAVEAVGGLKSKGIKPLFLIRGGIEPYGVEVLEHASRIGLEVRDVVAKKPDLTECIELISKAPKANVLNLKFFLPDDFVRLLYHCCDCVLANSGFEPFGLVGLEVMAAGGIAFTGSTGEEYVIPFVNAISVETNDPNEILTYMIRLHQNPHLRNKIKKEASKTAEAFTWECVIQNLLNRLEYIADTKK